MELVPPPLLGEEGGLDSNTFLVPDLRGIV